MWYRLAQARTFAWLTKPPPGYAGRIVLEPSRSGDVLIFEEMKGAENRRQLAAVFPQGAKRDDALEQLAVEMLRGRMKTVKRQDQNKLAEDFYAAANIQSLQEMLGAGFIVKGKSWTEAKTSGGPMSGYCWLVETPWGLAWLSRIALLSLSQARTSSLSGFEAEDRTTSSTDAGMGSSKA